MNEIYLLFVVKRNDGRESNRRGSRLSPGPSPVCFSVCFLRCLASEAAELASGDTGVEADIIRPGLGLSVTQFVSLNPLSIICKMAGIIALPSHGVGRANRHKGCPEPLCSVPCTVTTAHVCLQPFYPFTWLYTIFLLISTSIQLPYTAWSVHYLSLPFWMYLLSVQKQDTNWMTSVRYKN